MRSMMLVLPALLVLAACEKSDDDSKDKAPDAPFLNSDALASAPADTIDSYDAKKELKDLSGIFHNDDKESSFSLTQAVKTSTLASMRKLESPKRMLAESFEPPTADTPTDECDGFVTPFLSTPAEVDGDRISIGFISSVPASCSDEGYSTRYKVFVQYRVPGADLSSLDGKPLTEWGSQNTSDLNAPNSGLLMHVDVSMAGSSDGVKVDITMQMATSAVGGDLCYVTTEGTKFKSNCRSVSAMHLVASAQGETAEAKSVQSLTLNDVTYESETQSFYSSGTATIRINNWNGTATYTGPEVPPTISLSSGSEQLDFPLFTTTPAGSSIDTGTGTETGTSIDTGDTLEPGVEDQALCDSFQAPANGASALTASAGMTVSTTIASSEAEFEYFSEGTAANVWGRFSATMKTSAGEEIKITWKPDSYDTNPEVGIEYTSDSQGAGASGYLLDTRWDDSAKKYWFAPKVVGLTYDKVPTAQGDELAFRFTMLVEENGANGIPAFPAKKQCIKGYFSSAMTNGPRNVTN